MKVRCKYTCFGDVFPRLAPSSYMYSSSLGLISGQEYTVYGISTSHQDGKVLFLVINDEFERRYPSFLVSDLFDIVDHCLPRLDWCFSIYKHGNNPFSVLCYDEFTTNREHFEGVLMHDEEHLLIFEDWRKLVDMQYIDKSPRSEWRDEQSEIDGVKIEFQRNTETGEIKNFRFA